MLGTVRGEVQQLDRNLPLTGVFTLSDIFDQSLWPPRMAAALLAIFAGLSLVLAVIGIYGVMAYSVTPADARAGPADGARRIASGRRAACRVAGIPAHRARRRVGLIAAVVVTRLATAALSNLLFNVSATDVVTFVTVPVVLAIAALGASYIPALRATRIDPMVALRYE